MANEFDEIRQSLSTIREDVAYMRARIERVDGLEARIAKLEVWQGEIKGFRFGVAAFAGLIAAGLTAVMQWLLTQLRG